jgi:hypothetical protein
MLTGELPGKHLEPPSSKVQIDVRLDEVVLRALEKQPELRYQQVSEVKTMVETIVAMNPNPAATPAQSQPSARTMDNGRGILQSIMKTRILIILLIIVAFALATASAALYWRHLRPWQHVVNLDSFYQVRKASASPHSQSQNSDNNLNKFPAGYRIFNDVRFNVAGLLQLANEVDVRQTNCPYPTGVEGIPVNRFCHSIHLLHGTTDADGTENGIVVASLILHYADGTTNKLDIIYGRQVYDWWFQASDADAPLAGNTKVAWVGENSASKIRVFQTSFANPKPEVKIESVDYVSGLSKCAPFMLALTVEFTTTTHSLLLKATVIAAALIGIGALILLLVRFWCRSALEPVAGIFPSHPPTQNQKQPMQTIRDKTLWIGAAISVVCIALVIALLAFLISFSHHKLTVKAFIDGRDVLKVSGTRLWFEHETAVLPGKTIYVNGKAWSPGWTNNVSAEFVGLNPAFRPHDPQKIQITKRVGRGTVSVTQFPSPANDETLAVRLDDDVFGGADWYEVVISW